ncbi:hypothetical protein MOQ72_13325 [Saccharopolyspora sp. K220]|uniref:hypothetical protein n=1 Tax=Saccharopolyspora soli TaxID=2926618 RepID=UPI001F59B7EF|nr:hypothetical protein [Saccharopolyspora soli]MCI2418413.1 hypothetical protein [Saccharopolyspora soli]
MARVGGVSVAVRAPRPLPADITLAGVLYENHHSRRFPKGPPSGGRINEVWLVSWECRLFGRRWRVVEGTAVLSSVLRAPKSLRSEPPPEDGGPWRCTNGVLVSLEVPPKIS